MRFKLTLGKVFGGILGLLLIGLLVLLVIQSINLYNMKINMDEYAMYSRYSIEHDYLADLYNLSVKYNYPEVEQLTRFAAIVESVREFKDKSENLYFRNFVTENDKFLQEKGKKLGVNFSLLGKKRLEYVRAND